MELTEVVSPHFAFPVFGVVLCAVLVFAFGFKSPAQPPSFDFVEESEETKKRKTRPKKKATNGHAVGVEGSPAPQKVAVAVKSASTPKQEVKKEKIKKASKQVAPKAQPSVEPEQEEAVDGAGWTTTVSKKQRKQQKPKKKEVEGAAPEAKTNDSLKKSPPKEENVSKPAAVETQKPNAPVQQEMAPVAAESPKKSKKKANKASKPAALDVSELEEGEIRDDSVSTATAAPPAPQQQAPAAAAGKPSRPSPTELKHGWEFVEREEAEEGEIVDDADDDAIIDALQAAAVAAKKTAESTSAAPTSTGSSKKKKPAKPNVKPAKTVEPTPPPAAKSQGAKASASDSQPPAVTAASTVFDEMGDADWQDAKPVKRKKKARREN